MDIQQVENAVEITGTFDENMIPIEPKTIRITPDELQIKIEVAKARLDTLEVQHQEAFDRLTAELQALLDCQTQVQAVMKPIDVKPIDEKPIETVNIIK